MIGCYKLYFRIVYLYITRDILLYTNTETQNKINIILEIIYFVLTR